MGWEAGERFKREGAYVHLCLIHVDIWQKLKFCKAILLQLKISKFKFEKAPERSPLLLQHAYTVGS